MILLPSGESAFTNTQDARVNVVIVGQLLWN
jgi:hypothetical protein